MSESDKVYIDGRLVQWGERWDWTPQNQKPRIAKRSRSGIATAFTLYWAARQPAAMTPEKARRSIKAFVHKTPQILLKVTGGGKGLSHVMAHLNYISRNGQLALEDENGELQDQQQGLETVHDLWAYGHETMPEESQQREAINIVLSMPEGTDERAVRDASRAFAQDFFGANYQYVFVQHTFDTDPDPEPSRNPHVHLAVKVRGKDGTRLSPKKADLAEWREAFAQQLRDRGIEAVTSKRKTRFQRDKGQSQALRQLRVRHKQGRGVRPMHDERPQSQPAFSAKAKQDAQQLVKDYMEIASVLGNSPEREDRVLAIDLAKEAFLAAQREGMVKPSPDRGRER